VPMPFPLRCWIDEKVSSRNAILRYPCAGGSAEAVFAVPFHGTLVGGTVDLAATTTFLWSDGCSWESHQRIFGMLASAVLTYTYSEGPITGKSCAPAVCTARTDVFVR